MIRDHPSRVIGSQTQARIQLETKCFAWRHLVPPNMSYESLSKVHLQAKDLTSYQTLDGSGVVIHPV